MMYLLAGFEICSAAPTRKPLSALPHFHNSKIMLLFIYKDLIKQPIKISSLTVTMESYCVNSLSFIRPFQRLSQTGMKTNAHPGQSSFRTCGTPFSCK